MPIETELKNQLRRNGIGLRDVAERLRRPYGTVANWVNGFAALPQDARKEILIMIKDKEEQFAASINSTRITGRIRG